jgi:iron complex transport system substrate-binding protein
MSILKRNSILYILIIITAVLLSGCCNNRYTKQNNTSELDIKSSIQLEYATQFSIDICENGCYLIKIEDQKNYLLVPENTDIPDNIDDDITIINQNPENIYLAASSAMDFFYVLNSLDNIALTSTSEENWDNQVVKDKIENNEILYAGKYSAPDYEMILSENCNLAIESTMIYHSPDIINQLENNGVSVLIERSSYESNPLGRLEWIKLYGLLIDKEDEATDFFNEQKEKLENIDISENSEKTVAFFYINSNGNVNIRKPGDYVSEMIRMAGGRYIFTSQDLNVDENALSTMNIEMETFYSIAKNADILIYNSTVEGKINSIDELTDKENLLKDFKAVQNKNVWCTEKNMFQQVTAAADIISDLNKVISENYTENSDDELKYIYHLE